MRHIPNFITSLNLASGFFAVVFLFRGQPVTACWFLVVAMIFDFLDGFASRLLKAYSDMGKELDSLADMVSFGVAPGLIIYTLMQKTAGLNPSADSTALVTLNTLALLVSAAIPVAAGLRLAKFNIDTTQTSSFRGLPTPAAAIAVISVVLAGRYSDLAPLRAFSDSAAALGIFSLVISGLMVSRLPLLSLKFHHYRMKGNEGRYILIAVSALLVLILGFGGIPWIIPAYILISLLSLLL